jgi:alpha-methylacyl-CoA racemase
VIDILAAVNQRHLRGEGQQIDIRITDAMLSLNALFGSAYLGADVEPNSGTMSLKGRSIYHHYQTLDKRSLCRAGTEIPLGL